MADPLGMRRFQQTTDLVEPLDEESSEPGPDADDSELDWCFDDAELTRQLREVKRGRGLTITMLCASLAAVAAGIFVVL